jgi:subfamily B ATP-binding cassette protein HlyB/CyaB
MERIAAAERCGKGGAPDSTISARSAIVDYCLQGLVLLAQFHGIAADAEQLRHAAGRGGEPFDEPSLLLAAKSLGLKAKVVSQPAERRDRIALPALALRGDGSAFVIAKSDANKVLIHDLELQRPVILSREDFLQQYEGRLLTMASRASMAAARSRRFRTMPHRTKSLAWCFRPG